MKLHHDIILAEQINNLGKLERHIKQGAFLRGTKTTKKL